MTADARPGPSDPHPAAEPRTTDGDIPVTEEEWRRISRTGEFDHVVIGSGFCALAFAERVLRARPDARILMLERGEPLLDDHFQNLAVPFEETLLLDVRDASTSPAGPCGRPRVHGTRP